MKTFLASKDKFALLIMPGLFHELPSGHWLPLAPNTILTTQLNLPDLHWKLWLGTILWEEIVEAGFYLIVKDPTATPSVQNHKNQSIQDQAVYWWHALKVAGSFKCDKPVILTGTRAADGIRIESKSGYCRWYHQGDNRFIALTTDHLASWRALRNANEQVRVDFRMRHYQRIIFGLRNFVHAMELEMINWRLPALVRAIEAFVKPGKHDIGKIFARRTAFLTRDDNEFRNVSESECTDIYKLRCDYDHLSDMAMPTESEWQMIHTCENVARRLYQRFLLNPSFQQQWSDDTSIDAFWTSHGM
ncbi:MAG: hypothetical protein HY696_12040 [Deltaproteobacteria bacterium]|nr:hypothetical protein [Deltaproteobacteria bacterium]